MDDSGFDIRFIVSGFPFGPPGSAAHGAQQGGVAELFPGQGFGMFAHGFIARRGGHVDIKAKGTFLVVHREGQCPVGAAVLRVDGLIVIVGRQLWILPDNRPDIGTKLDAFEFRPFFNHALMLLFFLEHTFKH